MLGGDRVQALLLVCGSAAASALNFYSFVLLPTFLGAATLERFVRDNYYAGLYMASVVASVAPLTMFILRSGGHMALRRYASVAMLLWMTLVAGWSAWGSDGWAFGCLVAALAMHGAGFLLASLLEEGRAGAAAALQLLQPLLFAVMVTVDVVLGGAHRWALWYLVSSALCLAALLMAADWRRLSVRLASVQAPVTSWLDLLARIAASVSFALFFQLELILAGSFSSLDLGSYAVYQKLYASVAISLFGSVGVWLLARIRLDNVGALAKWLLAFCLTSFVAVMAVGVLVDQIDRTHLLSLDMTLLAACVAALFTACALVSLLLQHRHPLDVLGSQCAALALYLAVFSMVRPVDTRDMLLCCATFFMAFLLLAMTVYIRRWKKLKW